MINKKELLSDILIKQIVEMIDTNIKIYFNNSDDYFIELRNYCIENEDKKYEEIDQRLLLAFTEFALIDLINCPFLYDFRALE